MKRLRGRKTGKSRLDTLHGLVFPSSVIGTQTKSSLNMEKRNIQDPWKMQAKPDACVAVALYSSIRIWFLDSLWRKSHIFRGIITWEFGVFPNNSYIKNGHAELYLCTSSVFGGAGESSPFPGVSCRWAAKTFHASFLFIFWLHQQQQNPNLDN